MSSGESVHRRGLDVGREIPSRAVSTDRTFKSTSARAWEEKDKKKQQRGAKQIGHDLKKRERHEMGIWSREGNAEGEEK